MFGTIFNNLKGVDPRREIMLNEQFRMHPFIGDFISRIYYDKLKSGLENQESLKANGLTLDWAKNKVAVFVMYRRQKTLKQWKKRENRSCQVMEILDDLTHDPMSKDLSIGVITFYSAQVSLLRKKLWTNIIKRDNEGAYQISPDFQTCNERKN